MYTRVRLKQRLVACWHDAKLRIASASGLAATFKAARYLAKTTSDLVFPPRCVLCDSDLLPDAPVTMFCTECIGRLTPDTWRGCRRCGSELDTHPMASDRCPMCKKDPLWFDAVIPLGSYEEALRDVVLRMKRPTQETLSIAVGRLLAHRRHRELTDFRADLMVPIPMYWMRRLVRGVNSPELLSGCMGKVLRVPVSNRVLARRRNTKPQKDLRPADRFRNMEGAFRVRLGSDLQGARVLLVDDVMTTGATCSEAAKVLKEAGASMVAVTVVARAQGPQHKRKKRG